MWGQNTSGELGDNTLINKSSPIQTITSGTDWSQVSAGYKFTAAVKADGTLWLWGKNNFGQLGNNGYGATPYSSPIQTVAGGTNWKQVSAGSNFTGAVKTDGTLWMWGINSYGQMGTNSTSIFRQSSPAQTVAGGSTWRNVTTGYTHVMAIK
jgi:alpha-tubulin suppressor-like RCC1 family protein